jgi:ABC-type hemin transport system ATPase subunit
MVIMGVQGSGKSTVGKMLAKRLGAPLVDGKVCILWQTRSGWCPVGLCATRNVCRGCMRWASVLHLDQVRDRPGLLGS